MSLGFQINKSKGKGKAVCGLIMHITKMYASGYILNLSAIRRKVISFMPQLLEPWRQSPQYPGVSPKTGLDTVEKEKSFTCQGSNLSYVAQPVA